MKTEFREREREDPLLYIFYQERFTFEEQQGKKTSIFGVSSSSVFTEQKMGSCEGQNKG